MTDGARIELQSVGVDDHCGCRVEEYLLNGVDLHVHFEDGRADAYLDWGPDWREPEEISAPAATIREGRTAVLAWASKITNALDAMPEA